MFYPAGGLLHRVVVSVCIVLVMPGWHAKIMRQSYLCVCIPTVFIQCHTIHTVSVFITGEATVKTESGGLATLMAT